ncbi:uncharacterized protein F4807DRAFT_99815 [Annulohypoxylon truncatum]|uniref:uncharacterized protein n=1 Tax=Annulohypoxylon truncatum TaxID=327061 RepID=UPI0020074B8F|nr:uncharacterized protein F4807DRAFT_99815 [Annulohypoxylon truncatum]KAI1209192.1 hypothetical protein F4807DRAFT_99815 [Annulohypoxylon truncatum]
MRKHVTIILLALAATARVLAQDLNRTIVGCVELECPASSQDTANDNCTIADTGSFPYVGLTPVSSNSSSSLAGLSWVKGVNVTDSASVSPSSNSSRTFHSSFYLGTPSTQSLDTSTGACAVFLRGAESWDMSFGANANATDETAQGTCADAMGASCVDALVARAKTQVSDYYSGSGEAPSSQSACERLRQDLLNSTLDACVSVSKGSWTNFTAVALTGDDAPEPISQQENSSATCWPVTPKEDSLTLVAEFTEAGSDLVADAEEAFWAITPILTVVFSVGNGTTENAIDASLSCVKAMGPARASLDTINNGTDDQDNGATTLSSSHAFAATASCMVATFLFALYMM